MPAFWDLFEPDHGDLLYGRREQRDRYYDEYLDQTKETLDPDAWWTIDQYNNVWGLQTGYLTEEALIDGTNTPDPVSLGGRHAPKFDVRAYRDGMRGNRRRDPWFLSHARPDEIIKKEGWDVEVDPEEVDPDLFRQTAQTSAFGYKQLRRACKYGIEFVVNLRAAAEEDGPRIHFILDGLENDSVLKKRKVCVHKAFGVHAVPITSSELRNVYRNWDNPAFQEAIVFYLDFEQVDPPWERAPAVWQRYGKSRMRKLDRQLANMLRDVRLYPFRMEVKELMANAREAVRRARVVFAFNEAANTIKAAQDRLIGLMDGSVPPTSQEDILRNAGGRRLRDHIASAERRYDNRGVFSRRSANTKEAMRVLKSHLGRGDAVLLNDVHYYLGLEPAGDTDGLGKRLKMESRFQEILEDEYTVFRFGEELED